MSRLLLPLLMVIVLFVGCMAQTPTSSPTPPTAETTSSGPNSTVPETVIPDTATAEGSPETPQQTPIPDGHEYALNEPDPDKAVVLINEWNESADIHVEVFRNATSAIVYNETHTVEPDTEVEVYNTQASTPDGIEEFTVSLSARNTTESITIETNLCYGDARGEIQDDGSLYLYHAIC
jgi:hypothetical protein